MVGSTTVGPITQLSLPWLDLAALEGPTAIVWILAFNSGDQVNHDELVIGPVNRGLLKGESEVGRAAAGARKVRPCRRPQNAARAAELSMGESHDGEYSFSRSKASMRHTAPRTLVQALASCPPGWDARVREIFQMVGDARGTVWDCEPKFARLELGIELPDDAPAEIIEAINSRVAATAATCEACGTAGTLRDARQWLRVLCDQFDRNVDAHGWWDVYQRSRSREQRAEF